MLSNGQVPANQLTLVQSGPYPPTGGDIYLLNDAAAAWNRMRADGFRRFRVALNISSPGGGYRSLAIQRDMRANPTKYGAKVGKVAAVGSSVHGYGRSIDVWNYAAIGAYNFLTLARDHGFMTQTVSGETWHIEYPGGRADVAASGGGSSGVDVGLLRRRKEDSMFIKGSAAAVYERYLDPNGIVRLRLCTETERQWATVGGLVVQGNDTALREIAAVAGWVDGVAPTVPLPRVEATIDVGEVTVQLPSGIAMTTDVVAAADKVIAEVPPAVILEQKKPGN